MTDNKNLNRMGFKMRLSQFEFKQIDAENWEVVSEKTVLGKLADLFEWISPVLIEMVQGKEITTPDGILRIKNGRNQDLPISIGPMSF
jgi:hypothetical protein